METIYNSHDDNHIVMSEKVQSLAGSIYQEFERMIDRYDENVVKDLMPLVVNILECLDLAYTENQEHEVELELLREDNEQLVTQYEREKQLRKTTEQRLLEIEDTIEEERKETQNKVESLESIVRMFELKNKNASDHGSRLEDKVEEMKQEYSRLHERYTELFKTHVDYMERTKMLLGTDRLDQVGRSGKMSLSGMGFARSSGPLSFGFSSLEDNEHKSLTSPVDMSNSDGAVLTSIKNEMQEASIGPDLVQHADMSQVTDGVEQMEKATATTNNWGALSPDDEMEQQLQEGVMSRSFTNKEQRTDNTLYQELQFQEPDALAEVDDSADITVTDNFFGMGKEVENLITENNELLAYKNALNIVKDDLIAKVDELTSEQEILKETIKASDAIKARQATRLQELEEETKKMKTDMEGMVQKTNPEDEDDVPMAQRKRFTRVEMARVLMERNQYKERFMELQEAVRWTEMIRASKGDTEADKKNKQTIWKFFSNLFSTNSNTMSIDRPERALPYGSIRYDSSGQTVSPPPATAGGIETMRKKKKGGHEQLFDASELNSAQQQQRRALERREQYRAVRAHVKKDDGRVQAYGWSLPANTSSGKAMGVAPPSGTPLNTTKKGGNIPVPVPVYCRPLMEKEPGMKIWCAAGVNLTGGRTKDGGSVVGASIFYSHSPPPSPQPTDKNAVDLLEADIKDTASAREEGESLENRLSSLVWICTSTHSISKVTVIDANNPADILQSFHVCSSHLLCIASVPGAKETDYSNEDEPTAPCTPVHKPTATESSEAQQASDNNDSSEGGVGTLTFISCGTGCEQPKDGEEPEETSAPILRKEKTATVETEADECHPEASTERRLLNDSEDVVKDGVQEQESEGVVAETVEQMSSVLPTMWLGSQSGNLYVHSAVRNWKRCLHSIKLKDSVLSIVHMRGRVMAALADGTIAIFSRGADGQWDLGSHYLLDLGKPHHSIRCMHAVLKSVWCGYRNKIHVIDPLNMSVKHSFDAHPRKESQVRQMAWVGDGVWVSIRLDSTLRLYHAHTHQHLQDVDIEPYVSKMLGTGKLGFSFVRITSLLVSSNRLWIGTGNGVIISVPLSEDNNEDVVSSGRPTEPASGGVSAPGGVVRVYTETGSQDNIIAASFLPYCSMAQAQLSFHGHRDAVKFFVAVPASRESCKNVLRELCSSPGTGAQPQGTDADTNNMLVISGGEGYIDFRVDSAGSQFSEHEPKILGEGDEEVHTEDQRASPTGKKDSLSKGERSHLIVWSVAMTTAKE